MATPRRRSLYSAAPAAASRGAPSRGGSTASPLFATAASNVASTASVQPGDGHDGTRPDSDAPPRSPAGTRGPRVAPALAARWALLALLMTAMAVYLLAPWRKWVPQHITQQMFEGAVLETLEKHPTPSPAAKAYASVIPSVVRVIGVQDDEDDDDKLPDSKEVRPPNKRNVLPGPPAPDADKDARPKPRAEGRDKPKADKGGKDDKGKPDDDDHTVGTGVVIIDNGTILTNMHVVLGAKKVKVEFSDGLVSDADVTGVRAEHDLAVLRAKRIPDDLQAATMRSTADLKPGDRVTAIGFPFGIGPSVSHGVVSGLKRDFRSPKGDKVLSNLIQFDAAANPGNSGGPLITDDGAVVGIVTAIYNPGQGRFFVGLGFAVPIENAASAAGLPPF